jgi:ankyrin repeat protein
MGFSHIHLLVVDSISGDLVENLSNRTNRDQINTPDFTGKTALHWAAIRGDFQKIQILLQFRANVTTVDGSGSTPLMLAASSGCSKSLKSLLDAGSNVHSKNTYGSDALYYACRHQSELAPVIQLLHSGACVNSQNKNGHTALIGAAIRDNTKIGEYLLRKGATIDIRGTGGETALFEAIFHNSHRFLQLLFHFSADYTLVNNAGSTIIHSAALEGDCETLTIMLRADLELRNISHRNKDHLTAAEMIQRRSIIPEGFELIFSELLSSVEAKTNPDQYFNI